MKPRYVVAILLSVAFALFYGVAQSWGELLVQSTDMLFVLVSETCSLLGFLVIGKSRRLGRLGDARLGFVLSIFLWFLGETVYAVYEVGYHIPIPYPSLADVFYLSGYVPAAVGILWFLYSFREEFTRLKIIGATLVGIAIPVATSLALIVPVLASPGGDALSKTFDVAYPVLDTILLVLVVMMFMALEGGVLAKSWLWIGSGLILSTVADIGFSFGTLSGWYYSGHPIELFWLWGYVCIGIGFVRQRRLLHEMGKTTKTPTGQVQD